MDNNNNASGNDNSTNKYPILMIPAFKDYLWGGNRLITEWGKPSPYDIAAESWELSAHKNGQSIAGNGILSGKTLGEIVEYYGKGCLGTNNVQAERFPVLIKLIDSKQRLSIQVHPSDTYALANEGDYGKTEMWYIAEAQEGSYILCGFKKDITAEEYAKAIEDNTITDFLNKVPVKKGDVFFISPGTVHAICEGTIIAEIQQNSDVTYRVYDYNRVGADGKTRPLHISNAIDVSRLTSDEYTGKPEGEKVSKQTYDCTLLVSCNYFTVYEYDIHDRCEIETDGTSFQSLLFLEGEGEIVYNGGVVSFKRGDTFFIPADMGEYTIRGTAKVLLTIK